MSFLRHQQIYQSDVFCWEWQSEADYRFALPLIVLMSLRPAIPRRVALLHCSLPLHRTILMMKRVAGNCKPPLGRGWGIFSWRFGEFSLGVDISLLLRRPEREFPHSVVQFGTRMHAGGGPANWRSGSAISISMFPSAQPASSKVCRHDRLGEGLPAPARALTSIIRTRHSPKRT